MNKFFLVIFNTTFFFSNPVETSGNKIVNEIFLNKEEEIYKKVLDGKITSSDELNLNQSQKIKISYFDVLGCKNKLVFCKTNKNPPGFFLFLAEFMVCVLFSFFFTNLFLETNSSAKKKNYRLKYLVGFFLLLIIYVILSKQSFMSFFINAFFSLCYNFFYIGFFFLLESIIDIKEKNNNLIFSFFLLTYLFLLNFFIHLNFIYQKAKQKSLGWVFFWINIFSSTISGLFLLIFSNNFFDLVFLEKKTVFLDFFFSFLIIIILIFMIVNLFFINFLKNIMFTRHKKNLNNANSIQNYLFLKSLIKIKTIYTIIIFLLILINYFFRNQIKIIDTFAVFLVSKFETKEKTPNTAVETAAILKIPNFSRVVPEKSFQRLKTTNTFTLFSLLFMAPTLC